MAALSRNRILSELRRGDASTTALDRGACLESLIQYIFRRVPGIRFVQRNMHAGHRSEEIDLVFWNDSAISGLSFIPNILLFECKNWNNRVGSAQVRDFILKLTTRHIPFGILVAPNGVTGDNIDLTNAHSVIESAYLAHRVVLIVLDRSDLGGLGDTDSLIRLLQDKYSAIVLRAEI